MATQEVVKTLWKNWCTLSNEDREKVATHLGSVGRLLSIAANVQNIAERPYEEKKDSVSESKNNNGNEDDDIDADVIDVDFEEV